MEESTEDFYQLIAERRNQERTAIKSFVQGVIQGDLELGITARKGAQGGIAECHCRRATGR